MFKVDKWNPTILVEKNEHELWMSMAWPKFADWMTLRMT